MDDMLKKLIRFGKRRKANVPLALFCILVLYAVSAIRDYAYRLRKALWDGYGRRIAAAALSFCLVFTLVPMTAYGETGAPPDRNSVCIEAVEGEDGIGSVKTLSEESLSEESSSEESSSVETPSEERPTEELPSEEIPTEERPTEELPTEELPSEGLPSEEFPSVELPPGQNGDITADCICDTLCTEAVVNPDCPVCSAEGADFTKCVGTKQEKSFTYDEVVALFQALPKAASITKDTTDEEKDELMEQINAALAALETLSDEGFTKFNKKHSDLLEAVMALQAAIINDTPTVLVDTPVVELWRNDAKVEPNGEFNTLAAAITAAQNGDTLKIIDDIDLGTSGVTISGKSLTLDLNGKTITYSANDGTITLLSGAGLTVTDGGSGGKLEATGFQGIAIYHNSSGTVTVEGGTVSATGEEGIAIWNNLTGKVVIRGNAVITSANTFAEESTIYITAKPYPASIVLEITGGTIENTADPAGYSVYFTRAGITSANLSDYYSRTGGTVGRVHPEPPAAPTPTVECTNTNIYANGVEINIVAGTTPGYTNILYDQNGDGTIGETEYLKIGDNDPTDAGYDLHGYSVYGGCKGKELIGDTKITMTGGKVKNVLGGGDGDSVSSGTGGGVNGNTQVIIGGTVTAMVQGGSRGTSQAGTKTSEIGLVTGNTRVEITSTGEVGGSVYGGGYGVNVGGNTNVVISGSVTGNVYGGGRAKKYPNGNVAGTATVQVTSTGKVGGSLYGGGGRESALVDGEVGSASVTIGGGAKIGSTKNGKDTGIIINGGTANVTNGVDNFTIDPALVGDNDSIWVLLPAGYTTGTIATGAVQTDVSRIKLVGAGAEGKEVYLVGTEIKILNDEQKIALAKQAIETALANLTVTNATTAQEILNVANGVTLFDVTVTWDSADGFQKTEATTSAAGSMTGTLKLTLNSERDTVVVSKEIAKLPADTGGGSGGSSGSSSSGSSSSGSSDSSSTVTPPTEGRIKVEGTVDASGNVTVTLPGDTVDEAIKKAEDEARKNGNLSGGVTLALNISTGGGNADSVTVNLPKLTQETIINKKIANTVIMVDKPDIKIAIDLPAIQSINNQANADVNITATKRNGAELTRAAKAAIGSRPVYDFKVHYSGGKQLTSFDGGSISVAIPYILGAGEKAGGVAAVYIDNNGNVNYLTKSVYDSVNNMLRFSTNHFSTYGVGYQVPAEFTDISGHWAKDDIQLVVNRGLISGTDATTFSPDAAMTRGMFVTALGRLAGVDVSSYKESSFTDVKADACYMGYVEWAVKQGIVKGTTANTFAPDSAVSREQMADMMANYAKAIGYSLPKAHEQNTFADAAAISTWAADSVKAMQMAGVLAGKNGNQLVPRGTATRAEAAATLRRFMGLMIDVSTVQGWMRNDDGQWMYYENGRSVKNTHKNVDGEDYGFDAYGITLDFPKKKIGLPQ